MPKSKPATDESLAKAPPKPRLTDKQRAWLSSYKTHLNATQAARDAGYADAECSGFENRQNPVIAALIEEHLSALFPSAPETLVRLGQQARNEASDYLEVRHGKLILNANRLIEAGKGHLIKKFKCDGETGIFTEVEFYDAQAALVALGRHHKLFTDRIEADVTAKPISHDDTQPYENWDRAALNRGIEAALKAAEGGQ